ncbi:hypothetical protein [Azospirillum oleiclasticum]|uniref:Lipoprotein n=1 Tax=Azospirillum oleiclasticum TaxID=2735135 RepID=A0ABX2TBM8_9PROT|nr:hypothetical protein [Azospirillum oleiclasticum]NYZ21658.1 hypothetical protein [Azospirillum oleiclasticum]
MMIHAKIALLAITGALLTGCHGHHRAYGGGYGYYDQPRVYYGQPRVYAPPPVYERPRHPPPRRDRDDDRPRRDHHHRDGWNGDWHRRDRD